MYSVLLILTTYSLAPVSAVLDFVTPVPEPLYCTLDNAFKNSEYYDPDHEVTFVSHWISALVNGQSKMLVISKRVINPGDQMVDWIEDYFYLAMLKDANEHLHLTRRSEMEDDEDDTKGLAEHYLYSRYGFKEIWIRIWIHAYQTQEVSPDTITAGDELQSKYGVPNHEIVKAWILEPEKVVVVYQFFETKNTTSRRIPYYRFSTWLQTTDEKFEVIYTRTNYTMSGVEASINSYLCIPIEFGEPWRYLNTDLEPTLSPADVPELEAHVTKKLGAGNLKLQKAKRTRGDPSKVAAVFSLGDTDRYKLLMLSVEKPSDAPNEFIIQHSEEVTDSEVDDRVTAYISAALPFTQDWKTSEQLTDLERRVISEIETKIKPLTNISNLVFSCAKNVDSTYEEKAAIFDSSNRTGSQMKQLFVAWKSDGANISIKQVSELFDKRDEDNEDDVFAAFNFYAKSALAYTEDHFKYGTGWYRKDTIPSFITNSMKTIMEDYKVFVESPELTWEFEADFDWLQEAGRFVTGVQLDGVTYYDLIVKQELEATNTVAICVRCINGHYVEVVNRHSD